MGFPDSNFLSSFDGCSEDMVKSTKFSVHVVNVILFNEATVSAQQQVYHFPKHKVRYVGYVCLQNEILLNSYFLNKSLASVHPVLGNDIK